MHGLVAAEPLEHVGEERVAVAVVERDLGRRADDDQALLRPARRHGRRLEVGEVVLLLQAGVAAKLRRPAP